MKNGQQETQSERVTEVTALSGFRLLLTFSNMELRVYDCRSLFDSGSVLADRFIFNSAHTDSGGVAWDHGPSLDPDVLYHGSTSLVDFLNDVLGRKNEHTEQRSPYFMHDESADVSAMQAIVDKAGQERYEQGKRDEEASIAVTMIDLMQQENINNFDIINRLCRVLGISVQDARDYLFLPFH